MTTTKYCPKCEQWKSFEDFYKNRSKADGYQPYCIPCWKQLTSDSRQRHLEARRAQRREAQKALRQAHPEKVRESYKKWYERSGTEYHRGWIDRNREKSRESHIRWRVNHPLAAQVSGNNTRARRLGAIGIVTEQGWRAILEEHAYVCASCGEQRKLEIDHITPLKLGGANTMENIQPLCHACNTRKKQQLTDYRKSKE